jgi:hypothetical protein
MNVVLRMHVLNSTDHLVGEHQDCLHAEATSTLIEKIFQRIAQQIHDQTMIVLLNTIKANLRNANTASQISVNL